MDDKECVHHWIIDEFNMGHCIKPGCGAVKDFGALMIKYNKQISHLAREHGAFKHGAKRGRESIK